jgi:hypothetical protein
MKERRWRRPKEMPLFEGPLKLYDPAEGQAEAGQLADQVEAEETDLAQASEPSDRPATRRQRTGQAEGDRQLQAAMERFHHGNLDPGAAARAEQQLGRRHPVYSPKE